MVEASVLAAVDKLPLPRAARKQRGPHLLVGLRRGLATGHHRRLLAAHLLQCVAGVALVLRIDPVDAPVPIGDDHRDWAAPQRSAQYPEALQRSAHPRPAAQQLQKQQPQ